MLSCCRCIAPGDRSVRRGEWKVIMGHDLCEKTVGLLGFGNISKCVARRLRGFGCKVLAYDPFVTEVPEEFRDFVTRVLWKWSSRAAMCSRCTCP